MAPQVNRPQTPDRKGLYPLFKATPCFDMHWNNEKFQIVQVKDKSLGQTSNFGFHLFPDDRFLKHLVFPNLTYVCFSPALLVFAWLWLTSKFGSYVLMLWKQNQRFKNQNISVWWATLCILLPSPALSLPCNRSKQLLLWWCKPHRGSDQNYTKWTQFSRGGKQSVQTRQSKCESVKVP